MLRRTWAQACVTYGVSEGARLKVQGNKWYKVRDTSLNVTQASEGKEWIFKLLENLGNASAVDEEQRP